MGVILAETSNTRQAVGHATALEAMQATKIGDALRKFTIAMFGTCEHQTMRGAIHGLYRKISLFRFGEIHIVRIVIHVTRSSPKIRIKNLGRDDFLVTVFEVQFAHIFNEFVIDGGAFWMKKGRSRSFGVKRKKI